MGNLLQSLVRSNEDLSDEDTEPSLLLEQYASQVLDFSTQYGSDRSFSYTAANCLGIIYILGPSPCIRGTSILGEVLNVEISARPHFSPRDNLVPGTL